MKKIIFSIMVVVLILFSGCAGKAPIDKSPDNQAPDKDVSKSDGEIKGGSGDSHDVSTDDESEVLEDFDDTIVEDEELDVGEMY